MGGIVEGDQVDHTVLGTVGPCILKVLLLALTMLHCNIQKQKGNDLHEFLYLLHMYMGLLCTHLLADLGAKNFLWVFECVTLLLSLLAAKVLTSLRISIYRLV